MAAIVDIITEYWGELKQQPLGVGVVAKEGGGGRGGENKLIVEGLTFWYVSTKTHGFVTIKKKLTAAMKV